MVLYSCVSAILIFIQAFLQLCICVFAYLPKSKSKHYYGGKVHEGHHTNLSMSRGDGEGGPAPPKKNLGVLVLSFRV